MAHIRQMITVEHGNKCAGVIMLHRHRQLNDVTQPYRDRHVGWWKRVMDGADDSCEIYRTIASHDTHVSHAANNAWNHLKERCDADRPSSAI